MKINPINPESDDRQINCGKKVNDRKIGATHLKFITKIKRAQSMTMIMKQRLSENFGSRMAWKAPRGRLSFCLIIATPLGDSSTGNISLYLIT